MTATTMMPDVEQRRAVYSRELAAYTLRQWDTAYKAMEKNGRTGPLADKSSISSSRLPTSGSRQGGKDSKASQGQTDADDKSNEEQRDEPPLIPGVQVVDYARRSHKNAAEGSRRGERAVKA